MATHQPRQPTVQSERMDMLLRVKTDAMHVLFDAGWEPWRIALVLGWSQRKLRRVLDPQGATMHTMPKAHTLER